MKKFKQKYHLDDEVYWIYHTNPVHQHKSCTHCNNGMVMTVIEPSKSFVAKGIVSGINIKILDMGSKPIYNEVYTVVSVDDCTLDDLVEAVDLFSTKEEATASLNKESIK